MSQAWKSMNQTHQWRLSKTVKFDIPDHTMACLERGHVSSWILKVRRAIASIWFDLYYGKMLHSVAFSVGFILAFCLEISTDMKIVWITSTRVRMGCEGFYRSCCIIASVSKYWIFVAVSFYVHQVYWENWLFEQQFVQIFFSFFPTKSTELGWGKRRRRK